VELREAIRQVLATHTDRREDAEAARRLTVALASCRLALAIDPAGGVCLASADGDPFARVIGGIAIAIAEAGAVGTWPRLKSCPGQLCGWRSTTGPRPPGPGGVPCKSAAPGRRCAPTGAVVALDGRHCGPRGNRAAPRSRQPRPDASFRCPSAAGCGAFVHTIVLRVPLSGGYSSPQNGHSSSLCVSGRGSRLPASSGPVVTASLVSAPARLPRFCYLRKRPPNLRGRTGPPDAKSAGQA